MVSLPIFRLLFTANLILMTQNRLEIGRLWTIFQMFRLLFTTNLLLMTKNWSEIGRFWTILYRIAVESKNHLKFQKKMVANLPIFWLLFTTNLVLMTKNWLKIGHFWTILYRNAVESKNHLKFPKKWSEFRQNWPIFWLLFTTNSLPMTINWPFPNSSSSQRNKCKKHSKSNVNDLKFAKKVTNPPPLLLPPPLPHKNCLKKKKLGTPRTKMHWNWLMWLHAKSTAEFGMKWRPGQIERAIHAQKMADRERERKSSWHKAQKLFFKK